MHGLLTIIKESELILKVEASHQTSSRATLSRATMMSSLTSNRLDLRKYRGSLTDWLVDWDYRCNLYNDASYMTVRVLVHL